MRGSRGRRRARPERAHARPHPRLAAARARLPAAAADEESARALAQEIALRLRRHGITGRERLVLADRGDGVGAMPAAQMAELAGHPQVAILLGGIAAWDGELAGRSGRAGAGAGGRPPAEPACVADAAGARRPAGRRLADAPRRANAGRVHGRRGNQCDPRQGHIPGARLLEVGELFEGPGRPASPDRIRQLVGLPEGAEIVAYCHSGSRSALATLALRSAGYEARNYAGSWHEWSRHDELPLER